MLTDEMLCTAAAEADCALCESLLATMGQGHVFSARFERRMNRLLHRARHPILYLLLQRAACFLLLVILAGTTWLTVDVQARAAFFAWVRQQYESFTEYRFVASAPDSLDLSIPEPAWLPEGFEKQKPGCCNANGFGERAGRRFLPGKRPGIRQRPGLALRLRRHHLLSHRSLYCLTAPLPASTLIQIAESVPA